MWVTKTLDNLFAWKTVLFYPYLPRLLISNFELKGQEFKKKKRKGKKEREERRRERTSKNKLAYILIQIAKHDLTVKTQ